MLQASRRALRIKKSLPITPAAFTQSASLAFKTASRAPQIVQASTFHTSAKTMAHHQGEDAARQPPDQVLVDMYVCAFEFHHMELNFIRLYSAKYVHEYNV